MVCAFHDFISTRLFREWNVLCDFERSLRGSLHVCCSLFIDCQVQGWETNDNNNAKWNCLKKLSTNKKFRTWLTWVKSSLYPSFNVNKMSTKLQKSYAEKALIFPQHPYACLDPKINAGDNETAKRVLSFSFILNFCSHCLSSRHASQQWSKLKLTSVVYLWRPATLSSDGVAFWSSSLQVSLKLFS